MRTKAAGAPGHDRSRRPPRLAKSKANAQGSKGLLCRGCADGPPQRRHRQEGGAHSDQGALAVAGQSVSQ